MFAKLFNPLTDKEAMQLALYGLHSKVIREEIYHLNEIKVNVAKRWESTLTFIDELVAMRDMKHKEVV